MSNRHIPQPDPLIVDEIMEMLIEEQGMLRPPDKAAALLAIICDLHEHQEPFPTRPDVAQTIGCAVSTVDAALSSRIDEGYLTLRVMTKPGSVRRRNSVIRERYYEPSPRLLQVYENAKKKTHRKRQVT